jgi:hypothetical protein
MKKGPTMRSMNLQYIGVGAAQDRSDDHFPLLSALPRQTQITRDPELDPSWLITLDPVG